MADKDKRESTLAALLEEKQKRGRPKRAISRQNVYVALSLEQKEQLGRLAGHETSRVSISTYSSR